MARRFIFAVLAMTMLAACVNPNRSLTLPRQAGPVPVSAPQQQTDAEKEYWEQLDPARVIYIGETHDSNADHEYQWDVLKGLKARGVKYAVGWEMFDTTQQGALDEWGARRLSTDALLEKTDFQQHWGTLSVLYEKILRWSLAEDVPSMALNAPLFLSHKISLGQPLTASEREMLPTGFKPLPGGFEHFAEQLGGSPHPGSDPRNLYQAQLLWDQTMAARIVDFLEAHPDEKLIVLLGRGHLEGGYGVPAFVMQKSDARQIVVFPGGLPPAPQGGGHLALLTSGQRHANEPWVNRHAPDRSQTPGPAQLAGAAPGGTSEPEGSELPAQRALPFDPRVGGGRAGVRVEPPVGQDGGGFVAGT